MRESILFVSDPALFEDMAIVTRLESWLQVLTLGVSVASRDSSVRPA